MESLLRFIYTSYHIEQYILNNTYLYLLYIEQNWGNRKAIENKSFYAWLVSAIGHLQKQSKYYIRLRQVTILLQFIEHQIWHHNIRTNGGIRH